MAEYSNKGASYQNEQEKILETCKKYFEETGNPSHILVGVVEQRLKVESGSLQQAFMDLEENQKIEVVEKDENGDCTAFKLPHWTIRNEFQI